jgi:hypothetical protein
MAILPKHKELKMEFKIVDMQRKTSTGLVETLHWTCSQTDGEFVASSYGSIGLPEKDASDPSFVDFNTITEEMAVEWLKQTMGEEQVTALQANLDGQIEAQKNPVSASGLPWAALVPEEA